MSFENKSYVKEQTTYYNIEDLKLWFVSNGLYNDLQKFIVSPDGKTVLQITFKRPLTLSEKTAILSKFPMVSEV